MVPAIIGHKRGLRIRPPFSMARFGVPMRIGALPTYLSNFELISMRFGYRRASDALPISGKTYHSFRLWSSYVQLSYPIGRNR